MLSLLIIGYSLALSVTGTKISCPQTENINVHCADSIVLDSKNPIQHNVPAIHLINATVDYLSPEMLERASNVTKLLILDGSAPKVHLKPSLKSFTSLRAGTSEVVIDPVENFQLELFDVEGSLRSLPTNVNHLRALAVLDLCQNQIESVDLDQLSWLKSLSKLNLGWNRIRTVRVTNAELPALAELFLHGNQLTILDLTHLAAPALQRFYVSSNQLERIGGFPAGFSKLTRVDLHRNRWSCDWLRSVEELLELGKVETLSFLPEMVCDEGGSLKVTVLDCVQ